jgi:hypothetical protein
MIKGYARVSTDGQTLNAQQAALQAAGAERVFAEKQSGVKTDRAALARCMASLEPGDTLLVTKLDRLARSTRDLLNTLATIGEAGAGFRSLGDPWADTTTPHGRLMLTVLGGLAEFERHLILTRTDEGRAREGQGREVRSQASPDQTPTRGGIGTAPSRRKSGRSREELQRFAYDDLATRLTPVASSTLRAPRGPQRPSFYVRGSVVKAALRYFKELVRPLPFDAID